MKRIYIAGTTILVERERRLTDIKPERLHSFFFVLPDQLQHKAWEDAMTNDKPIKIFLDSGAFSAFSQGIKIDIQEYIQFIKKYEDKLEVYSVLDVIGNPRMTYQNQITMEKAGLKPLPCFHYGEDISWLERYMKRGYDYIALGGMVPVFNADLYPWLDHLFSGLLTDLTGMPIIKVHGFGMTSFDLMLRYPWYSVDSTTWIITGRTGGIYVPVFRDGKYDYSKAPFKITVSNRSPDSACDPDHISCMPKRTREIVMDYITSKGYGLGQSEWVDVPLNYVLKENERWTQKKTLRKKAGKATVERILESGLSNDYCKRDEMNIIYFADLEKSLPEWPWPFKLGKKRGFGL